jgi:DNA-binding MarR family transcriptional regulator
VLSAALFEEPKMIAVETVELLLQAARVAQAERTDSQLRPAEWMALRFIGRANEFSRTPSALADFQATTRATASHAVKQLEAGGYIAKKQSRKDGRSFSLTLTKKGRDALAHDPVEVLVEAIRTLPKENQSAIHDALRLTLVKLSESGEHRHFDVCKDCIFLGNDTNGSGKNHGADAQGYKCRMFRVPIDAEDVDLLCGNFQQGNGGASGRT